MDQRLNQTQPFSLKQLFFYFLKLGSIGFGGPIALVGYMQKDLIEKYRWFSEEEYLHGLALAQIVPGPLATQLAIYFGYLKNKILGATVIAIAFILPSLLMVCTLSYFYIRYQGLAWLPAIFYGMGAAAIAVMAKTAWSLAKLTLAKEKSLYFVCTVLCILTV